MSKPEVSPLKTEKQIALVPKYVFGIRVDLKNCIQFFSAEKCAYIAGYYGVICLTKRNSQYFIPACEDYDEISSFAVDEFLDRIVFFMSQIKEDKLYFIFKTINKITLDKIEPGKAFFIPDSSNTKILYFQAEQLEVTASALNLKSDTFAALIGPNSPNMVIIYSCESKSNPRMTHKYSLSAPFKYENININRHDPDKLAVWGDGGFAIINKNTSLPNEYTAKNFTEAEKCSFNIVSCTWINATCVAFMNINCDIMIMDFLEKHNKGKNLAHRKVIRYTSIFEVPPKGVGIFEKADNLFITRQDGFIVKLDNKSTKEEILFEKSNSSLKPVLNLPIMDVQHLSPSRVSDTSQAFSILMATTDSQIYILDMSNDNAICDGNNYKHLLCSFHSSGIISIAVSKWKQLVATCSRDKTVRIWDYFKLQFEAEKTFTEEPLKIAFHPNGLHLAVLFKDNAKIYDIVGAVFNESRTIRERGMFQAKDIKFSSFGTMVSVCYKTSFDIYNFYTGKKMFESNVLFRPPLFQPHTDTIFSLTWDSDDNGFVTCGNDGKVIYWNINNFSQPIVYQEQSDFFVTQVMTLEDSISKKIFALSGKKLIEIYNGTSGKDEEGKNDYDRDNKVLQSNVIVEGEFSDIFFDQELKLIFLAVGNDEKKEKNNVKFKEVTCALKIFDYNKYSHHNQKEFLSFPANGRGVRTITASSDMTHVFSGGADGCLFFFNLINIAKIADKRDIEILTPEDLILITKTKLDDDAKVLRRELEEKDNLIMREEEDFKTDEDKYIRELEKENMNHKETKENFDNQRKELQRQLRLQEETYRKESSEAREEHEAKMSKLMMEHEQNMKSKEEDKKTEEKILKEEETKDKKNLLLLNQEIRKDENALREENQAVLEELNIQIEELKKKHSEILGETEEEKKKLMEQNDEHIAEKRRELDKLKESYEKTKQDHKEKEDKLKEEIKKIKEENNKTENLRIKLKGDLEKLQETNQKTEKQIRDMQNDKNEKEETIKDKNELKRKLDKDNQELEKFKYVLHYKIKELKHNKEPKERKIQQMEKKAKDMEREIKSCELGQATIIIELSTNHQIIKIHEEQITKTEKRIEELRKYKKLFQENLYNSMKRAKNHKDCKRELVLLKRNFLDKEKIENVEKPFESNYELQREFLEKNVDHYKTKITKLNELFVNDHNKVMKEKRQLIEIVNQLEKEKKEIEDNEYNKDKISSITKPKMKVKADVPKFSHLTKKKKKKGDGEITEEDEENTLKDLAETLKEIEKEIQLWKYWQKKQENEKASEKKQRKQEEDDNYY